MRSQPAIVRLRPPFVLLMGLIAVLVATLEPPAVHAQSTDQNSLFSTAPSGSFSPNPGSRGDMFTPGDVLAAPKTPLMMPPAEAAMPKVPAGKVALALSARFGKEAPPELAVHQVLPGVEARPAPEGLHEQLPRPLEEPQVPLVRDDRER